MLDSGEDDGQGWIIMELVDGHPLTDYVGDGNRLTTQQLIPILAQTAYALDASAAAGVVHRDIKPANIMIRPDGIVKLTDFGISFAEGQANLTAVGMVMGTAQYLAPEQALGEDATSLGDLYALGVIAYEALAGKRPFTGKSAVEIAMSHVKDEVPPLPSEVPEQMQQVVYDLLAKEPQERPQSGAALIRTLSRVADELGASTSPLPLPSPTRTAGSAPRPNRAAEDKQRPVGEGSGATLPSRQGSEAAPAQMHQQVGGAPAQLHEVASDVPASVREIPPATPGIHPPPRSIPAAPTERAAEFTGEGLIDQEKPSADHQVHQWHPVSGVANANTVVPAPSGSRLSRHSAASDGPDAKKQDSSITSNSGMWLIVALVILTVILIFIAMVRDRGSADAALELSPVTVVSSTEVQTWLIPTLDC